MGLVSRKNDWRRQGGGSTDWSSRLDRGAISKYFVVSSDTHANEPLDLFTSRVDAKYKDRLPRVKVDPDGTQWLLTDGWDPQPVKVAPTRTDLLPSAQEFESFEVMMPYSERMEDEDVERASAGRTVEQRLEHANSQGVDAEIIFGQKGLLAFATSDPEFSGAMCRAWNRWALETFSPFDRFLPMAMIAPGVIDEAVAEVRWAAAKGFRGILIPNRPIFNRLSEPRNRLEYVDKSFEPLWAAIAESNLPITLHVSTGEDPRSVRGNGGAITNFVCHSMTTTIEPLVQLITSGVFERHPTLRLGTIESGIGWLPWLLQQMDYSYRAHHMWVRPVIPHEPSFYYKRNCFSSFIEEPEALDRVVEAGLEKNIVWSNDYPHQEGSYPHAKASIERQMANLTEAQRASVLGENAARFFNIPKTTGRE